MSLAHTRDGADLGRDPVRRLLFQLALPCILAQLINLLYNLVDRMYIGHIPQEGPTALTGVGVTMPLILCVSAFAALVDPELAVGMPTALAVSSALDAVAHAVESYWARGTNAVSRGLALEAIRTIMGHMDGLLAGTMEAL